MKQITFKQYRAIDLVMFCAITAVFESILCMATNQWFVIQAMSVTLTLTMTCITAFRWSYYAAFPAIVGSLAYCIVSKADIKQAVAYCGGSLFCLIAIPLLEKLGKDKVRADFIKRSAFVTVVYLATAMGRWLISLLFEQGSLALLITVDILSLLFAIVVLTLAKRLDGVLEDQKSYILRLDKERREMEESNQSDPFNDPYQN